MDFGIPKFKVGDIVICISNEYNYIIKPIIGSKAIVKAVYSHGFECDLPGRTFQYEDFELVTSASTVIGGAGGGSGGLGISNIGGAGVPTKGTILYDQYMTVFPNLPNVAQPTFNFNVGDYVTYNGKKDRIMGFAEDGRKLLLKSGAEIWATCATPWTEPTYNWSQIDDEYQTKYMVD